MESIKRYLLAALFFSIPLYPKLTTLCIMGYALFTLVGFKKKNLSRLWDRKTLLLLAILYVLFIIGLSYTIDVQTGVSKIQTQASFFVIPFFFIDSFHGKEDRSYFFQWFNWGLLVTVLICFLNAFGRVFSNTGLYVVDAFSKKHNIFLYQEFSGVLDLHPTYFSLYLGLAIFYLLFAFRVESKYKPALRWTMIVIFFIALFLTSSKAGIFSFMLISFAYQLYRTIKMKKKSDKLIFPILILGFVLMFMANPLISKRTFQAFKSTQNFIVDEGQSNESTSKRFSLWHVSVKSIEEKMFLGYGTGSVNKVLNNSCIEFFSFSVCEGIRNNNTHNQYLNLALSNGLPVLILFVAALLLALFKAVSNRDALYVLFTLFFALNFFFESLLERERGVVFFMVFMVLLHTTSDIDTDPKKRYEE
ncbi:O-antigen ligase family protein [Maribacter sp. 2307UL18-2]|uniref:O-antigen ligase family protein n=1 Tax=Maribacter sp. 2307UL18-2 TaxID=3386274 RepID=UPI0039BC723F